MRRWLQARISRVAYPPWSRAGPRHSSTVSSSREIERVSVRCGSAGSVYVDLHNLDKVTSSHPLLVYLPPYSSPAREEISEVPGFCRNYPTAVINYRWAGYGPYHGANALSAPSQEAESDAILPPLTWPIPVHDTLQAYSWIIENLTPPTYARRDVYVYGSYLGASLATSLALTESYPHEPVSVRGLVAYNGIYNWTTFLPDHPANHQSAGRPTNVLEDVLGQSADPIFQELKQHVQALFGDPTHLFDPFASSSLFFESPGMWVPRDFTSPNLPAAASLPTAGLPEKDMAEITDRLVTIMVDKPPKQSPLTFPPRGFTLELPESLLLHTRPPGRSSFAAWKGRRQQNQKRSAAANHFAAQAEELAALMRRSLTKLEFKEHRARDVDFDEHAEAKRRVQVRDIGADERPERLELPPSAAARVSNWLDERMKGRD
ncbi:uncharacterized protein BCR38DRAFT_410944 [Pseudomassariella vexata]|uniref:Alpha/Beta hydrolase protein n=1 Tax=Pseudomassariella vexata TaxID=1141098 RepID=A0A1Y2DTH3_9PEZI|nr:uncharacterized protein BCR38DRAFT_410944 [Pseudomassariella vexata]ORY62547.1 hypothetical protein BCR38DRAFT_410944 [Pseudomassariella vexata]